MPSRSLVYPHSPGAAPHQVSPTNLAANYMPKLVKAMVQPPGGGVQPPGDIYGASPGVGTTTTVHTPGGWEMPDYQALIAADPGLAAANATIRASGENAAAARAAQAQQAVIKTGFAPTQFGNQFGDITAETIQAALANPQSTLAQLQLTRSRGSTDLAAALAARGGLSSGGLAGGEQRLLEGFQGGQATAAQQLLDALSGYESTYGSTMSDLERQRLQAARDAALLAAQMNPPTWMEGTDVTTTSTPYGDLTPSYADEHIYPTQDIAQVMAQTPTWTPPPPPPPKKPVAKKPVRSPYYYGGGEF
jgi:hypothetical protein